MRISGRVVKESEQIISIGLRHYTATNIFDTKVIVPLIVRIASTKNMTFDNLQSIAIDGTLRCLQKFGKPKRIVSANL